MRMDLFDFWIVYVVSNYKRHLLKAGIPASSIQKVRKGWSKSYGGRSYPRYHYVANVDYVDAPAGRDALNAVLAKWDAKGLAVNSRYVARD